MRTIKASEFKSKCLALMDTVAATGEALVDTKNGKPVAEFRPYSGGACRFALRPSQEPATSRKRDRAVRGRALENAGVILDTQTMLWLDRDDPALGQRVRRRLEAAWRAGLMAVSAITFWEAAMQRNLPPLTADQKILDWPGALNRFDARS